MIPYCLLLILASHIQYCRNIELYNLSSITNNRNIISSSFAVDLATSNIYIYGGVEDYTALSNLYMFNRVEKSWTTVFTSTEMKSGFDSFPVDYPSSLRIFPGSRYGSVAFFSYRLNCFFTGYGTNFDSDIFGDLWKYNLTIDSWSWVAGSDRANVSSLSSNQSPSSRANLGYEWDETIQIFYMIAGFGFNSNGAPCDLNDIWSYSPLTNEFKLLFFKSLPKQYLMNGIFDNKVNFGPMSSLNSVLNRKDRIIYFISRNDEIWAFNTNINKVAFYNASTSKLGSTRDYISDRSWRALYYDYSGALLMYGGVDFKTKTLIQDLWRYNFKDGSWVNLTEITISKYKSELEYVSGSACWQDHDGFYISNGYGLCPTESSVCFFEGENLVSGYQPGISRNLIIADSQLAASNDSSSGSQDSISLPFSVTYFYIGIAFVFILIIVAVAFMLCPVNPEIVRSGRVSRENLLRSGTIPDPSMKTQSTPSNSFKKRVLNENSSLSPINNSPPVMFYSSKKDQMDTEIELEGTDFQTQVDYAPALSVPAYLKFTNLDFILQNKIAAGGDANVFLAVCTNPEIKNEGAAYVVAKVMKNTNNNAALENLQQEVSIMNLLKEQKNISKFLGYCMEPPTILMKYYKLGTLCRFLKDKNRRMIRKSLIVALLNDISHGIQSMHRVDISHNDLKTVNVLLDQDQSGLLAVITDFGIAKILSDKVLLVKKFQVVNRKGLTYNYAAPEVYKVLKRRGSNNGATPYDKERDVYAFSHIVYACMQFAEPWTRGSSQLMNRK